MPLFAIGMPGPWELAIILVIVVMLFGLGRLPQVFEQLGKGLKSFRDAQKDEESPKRLSKDERIEEAEEVAARDRAEERA